MAKIELSNLNRLSTSVMQGTKAARGVDSLEGEVMQFSSLMNVMNDDFSMMKSMETVREPNKIEQFVPEEFIVPEKEIFKKRDQEGAEEFAIDEEASLQDVDGFIADEIAGMVEEEQRIELEGVIDPINWDLDFDLKEVDLEHYKVKAPEEATPVSFKTPEPISIVPVPMVDTNVNPDVTKPQMIKPVVQVVPDIQSAYQEIVKQVVTSLEKIVVEEIEQEEPKPLDRNFFKDLIDMDEYEDGSFEGSTDEDPDLDLMSRRNTDVSTIGKDVSPEVDIPKNNTNVNSQVVQADPVAVAVSAPQVVNAAPVVDSSVSAINNSQNENKAPKLPVQQVPRKPFAQMLSEANEIEEAKMAFNSKLLQRLELVINDPSGTLDVEIAQDAIGIHVKAVMPTDVIRDMMGLEQDLQSALQDQGMELGSFHLEERDAEHNNSDGVNGSRHIDSLDSIDEFEQDVIGGIFVNRRV